jgi:hypothetical protein
MEFDNSAQVEMEFDNPTHADGQEPIADDKQEPTTE